MKKTKNKNKNKNKKLNGSLEIPKGVSENCRKGIKFFNKGDFKSARTLCEKVLKNSKNKAERVVAKDILDKTQMDWVIFYLSLGSILFLIFIFGWAVKISH
jgi:Na+/phosphate symporter